MARAAASRSCRRFGAGCLPRPKGGSLPFATAVALLGPTASHVTTTHWCAAGPNWPALGRAADVHNRIEQTSTSSTTCSESHSAAGTCLGGWGRISSYVKAARKKAPAQTAGVDFEVMGGGGEVGD